MILNSASKTALLALVAAASAWAFGCSDGELNCSQDRTCGAPADDAPGAAGDGGGTESPHGGTPTGDGGGSDSQAGSATHAAGAGGDQNQPAMGGSGGGEEPGD